MTTAALPPAPPAPISDQIRAVVAGGPAATSTATTSVLTVIAGQTIALATEAMAPVGASLREPRVGGRHPWDSDMVSIER